MAGAIASSVLEALLATALDAVNEDVHNRLALDGVTYGAEADGTMVVAIRQFESTSLRLTAGRYTLEIGRLILREIVARLRIEHGRMRLCALQAACAELSGVKVHGPLTFLRYTKKPARTSLGRGAASSSGVDSIPSAAGAWHLGPLGAADGRIRAEIVEAHLMFDADVTVPLRRGKVDFNEATVAHVGPNSRMGVSRLGLYVDAPNGRSYIYQFAATPIAGVEFERRGALPGPWGRKRGSVQLQAFAEGLLSQGRRGAGAGFTEQARELFGRTSISGDLQLSDGRLAAPGAAAVLGGRAKGCNAIRLHSTAVGRGLTAEIASLYVRDAGLAAGGMRLASDEIAGSLALRVLLKGRQWRFALDIPQMKCSGLRVAPAPAAPPAHQHDRGDA